MKLSINKESWHYKLARYGGLISYEQTDLCSYFWSLLWGVGRPILVVVCGVLSGYVLLLAPAIALIAWISGLPWLVDSFATIGAALWVGGVLIFTMIYRIDQGKALIPGASNVTDLVAAGYRGWKEKTCVLIDVK